MANSAYKKLVKILASKKFFWAVVGLLIFESAWIALTSRYPMAFDEDFHFGVIKLYSLQWSPFLTHHPYGSDAYGAISRDPSYLYHYSMSFIYRFLIFWVKNQTIQVIIFRFIDIGLFAWGLTVFRRLLLKTKASTAIIHTSLLFFVLIPIVPLLAGQINYDNLFIPLTALALLWTVEFAQALRRKKWVDLGLLCKIIILCLLTSLVQYSFLPVFLAIVLYLGYILWQFVRPHPRFLLKLIRDGWNAASFSGKFLTIIALLISIILFSQRIGLNAIKYHKPIPNCSQVLTIKECMSNGPWARNYYYLQTNSGKHDSNPLVFTADWFHDMFERSFFTLSGPTTGYETRPYLPIIALTSVVIGSVGVLAFLYYSPSILRKNPAMKFLVFAVIIYISLLWLRNYADYKSIGQPVALNGRYLLPVLPIIFLAVGRGYQRLLRHQRGRKGILLAIVFVLFLEGGGALTYIIRSNDSWYWPNSQPALDANHAVKKVINPVIFH